MTVIAGFLAYPKLAAVYRTRQAKARRVSGFVAKFKGVGSAIRSLNFRKPSDAAAQATKDNGIDPQEVSRLRSILASA